MPCISPNIKISGILRRCRPLPSKFSSEANSMDMAIRGSTHAISGLIREAEVRPRDIL
jgi:hypothetical protein